MEDGFQINVDTKNRKYHFLKYWKFAKDIIEKESSFDRLLPACLYLRLSLEDLIHQEFLYYIDCVPKKSFKRWQPRALLSFLSDNFNTANNELKIELYRRKKEEKSIPEDSKPLFVCRHTKIDIKTIEGLHHRLSSKLHAPNPYASSNLVSLKTVLSDTLEFFEGYSEQTWIELLNIEEETYLIDCECGKKNSYSLRYLENNNGFHCSHCDCLYYIDLDSLKENDGTYKVLRMSKPVRFKCSTQGCNGNVFYDLFRPALDFIATCKECDTKYLMEIQGKAKPLETVND